MPTPVGPNMTGPDLLDVAALMNALEALHQVSVSIRLFTLPMAGVGELGVLLEAERKDGTLGSEECLALIRAARIHTSSGELLQRTLYGLLLDMDGLLSKTVWEQIQFA